MLDFYLVVYRMLSISMKMKYLLIVVSLAIAKADVIKEETSTCYEKETIKTDLQHSTILNMAIDSSTNTLYFRYFQIQDAVNMRSRIVKIELDTNSFKNIEIYNANSLTVDEKKNDVYIGTIDGFYKYSHDTNKVEWIGLMGSHIETLFYKDDVLYYSESSSHYLYTYSNGTAVRYEDLEDTKVYEFLIDNEDTMFFTNTTGFFSQKKGTKNAVLFNKFPNDEPKRINMNKNGDVFLCLSDGIYIVDKQQSRLAKILTLDGFHFIAFDKETNFVYVNWASLFRLKPSDKKCDIVLKKNTYYEKETIRTDIFEISDIDADSSTNTLYIAHMWEISKIELDTNSFTKINNINDSTYTSVTVDKKSNDVYMAHFFGVDKYDHNTSKVERVFGINLMGATLFYKDDILYYTQALPYTLYKYSNGVAVRNEDLKYHNVRGFLIDDEGTMFFTNTTGLFSQKKGTKDVVLVNKFSNDQIYCEFYILPKMKMNKNGDVFMCLRDGIHKIDKEKSSLEKIITLNDCISIAFDKDDNFVCGSWISVYRLKPL